MVAEIVVVMKVIILLVVIAVRVVLFDTFVEVLAVGMSVGVLIIVSDVAVDLLMDALTLIISGVLPSNDVDVVDGNVVAGVIIALGFAMPCPLEEFRC